MTPKERAAMQQALEASEALESAIKRYQSLPMRVDSYAIESCEFRLNDARKLNNAAITALREALAEQAEQEPVAIVVCNRFGVISLQRPDGGNFNLGKNVGMKFYTAPQPVQQAEQEPMTNLDMLECWMKPVQVKVVAEISAVRSEIHPALPMGTLLYAAPQPVQEPEGRCKLCLAYNGHLDFCPALAEQEVVLDLEPEVLAKLESDLAKQAEPVAWMHTFAGDVQINNLPAECYGDHWTRTPLYAAPVRTKDLTDDEIEECVHIADSECTEDACMPWFVEFARAVIAADRENNK